MACFSVILFLHSGESSSITLVASSDILSHFKAALSNIAASHHFLLCTGCKDKLYYIEHPQAALAGPSFSPEHRTKQQAGTELLLLARGKLSTGSFALQSFSLLLVDPSGALSFAGTENKPLGPELLQIFSLCTSACPAVGEANDTCPPFSLGDGCAAAVHVCVAVGDSRISTLEMPLLFMH